MNKREKMQERILKHGLSLARYYGNSTIGPKTLCQKLRRIENKFTRISEGFCNGTVNAEDLERASNNARKGVLALLPNLNPKYLKINQDPRGYALKIRTEYAPEDMHRDWGGYGIIAPDLS